MVNIMFPIIKDCLVAGNGDDDLCLQILPTTILIRGLFRIEDGMLSIFKNMVKISKSLIVISPLFSPKRSQKSDTVIAASYCSMYLILIVSCMAMKQLLCR